MKKLFIMGICLVLSTSLLSGCFGKKIAIVDDKQTTESTSDSKDSNTDSKTQGNDTENDDVSTSSNNSSVSNTGASLGYTSLNINNICDDAFSGNNKLNKITSITNDFYKKVNNTFPLYSSSYYALVPPTGFESTSDRTQYALTFDTIADFTFDNIPNNNSLKEIRSELIFFLDSNSYGLYDTIDLEVNQGKDLVLTDSAKNLIKATIDDDSYSSIEKALFELNSYAKTNKDYKEIEISTNFKHILRISVLPADGTIDYSSFQIQHEIHDDL